MNRGRERQRIFHRPEFYEAFLKGLDEAHRRFGMEIHAYCLMGNHYHLLIKTRAGEQEYTQVDCDEVVSGSGQRQTHRDSRAF